MCVWMIYRNCLNLFSNKLVFYDVNKQMSRTRNARLNDILTDVCSLFTNELPLDVANKLNFFRHERWVGKESDVYWMRSGFVRNVAYLEEDAKVVASFAQLQEGHRPSIHITHIIHAIRTIWIRNEPFINFNIFIYIYRGIGVYIEIHIEKFVN